MTDISQYIPLIDLTRLGDHDTPDDIKALCQAAQTPYGDVAAVCVQPQLVNVAAQQLSHTPIKVATVANFPDGTDSLIETHHCIEQCLLDGADEVDVVLPYRSFLAGEFKPVMHFLKACRQQLPNTCLKVILETGAYTSSEQMTQAALLAIDCGADFIKTSTGKIAIGATPEAATAMLAAIQQRPNQSVGIKLSGGIRDLNTATLYYQQVLNTMGETWIQAQTLRFGASGLLQTILDTLSCDPSQSSFKAQ